MSNEFNYDNDIPVAPFVAPTRARGLKQCQFAHDEYDLCGLRSVACTRCGEDTELCRKHTEGLCAECREEPDPRAKPMSEIGLMVFELARDLNRVYLAGMKAGRK